MWDKGRKNEIEKALRWDERKENGIKIIARERLSERERTSLFAGFVHNIAMQMETVPFEQAFANFFTQFLGLSFIFEIVCIVFFALQATGRFDKSIPSIITEVLFGLVLAVVSFFLSVIGYATGASLLPSFSALLIIIFLIIPGGAFILIYSKGRGWHRVLRALFFLSVVYLTTEIAHHYNMLIGPLVSGIGRDFLFCVPFLLLIAMGLALPKLKIHHVRNPLNFLTVMCLLVFALTLVFALVSSRFNPTESYIHGLMIFLLVLLAGIDFWSFYLFYKVDKAQRTITVLTAESQLNEAATIMLKMNEESIQRTTFARHDLRNTLSFVSQLIKEGKYDQAIAFIDESEKNVDGELPIVDCGNGVVSSIMNLERKKASFEGVEVKYRLIVPPTLPIEDTILCSLLTNIIDNAIAGTKESGKDGYVDFSMILHYSVLRIRCVNPTNLTSVPTLSSKSEAGHGYGVPIIKNNIAELGGYVKFGIDNGDFAVDAIITLDTEEAK